MDRENLPLFYYPSTWIYIDDDKNLLKSMTYVLSEFNSLKLFESPKRCIEYLSNYTAPSTSYSFLKSVVDDEKHGVLHHTPIDFDVTTLVEILNRSNRSEEITAIVIDYGMPEIDGLSLAKYIHHIPAKKILLTGENRGSQAIQGFNDHLIQCFIQKFENRMEENLISYLQTLTLQYFQDLTAPLLAHLETENKLPLTDPVFIKFFNNYCYDNQISEYYLIDKQGSFLCINKEGKKSFLVMQSDKGIVKWLSTYITENEIAQENILAMKSQKIIPFFGIGKEPWQVDINLWPNNFYPAKILEGREKYFWTIIDAEDPI